MPSVSHLFIDKLTVVYNGINTNSGFTEYMRSLQNARRFEIRWRGINYLNRGYRYAWHISLLGVRGPASILILAEPFRSIEASFLSVEWNPNKLGYEGQQVFWQVMREILIDDFDPFIFQAIITRIDLSIDIYPLTVDAILVSARRMRFSDHRCGNHGLLESLRLGSRHSALSFLIYQRRPADSRRVSHNPFTTRLEATIKPRITLHELHSTHLPNPFSRLLIVNNVNPVELSGTSYQYKWLLDSARLRALQSALLLIDSDRTRNKYRRWLIQNLQTDWFNADAIWREYDSAISVLGLQAYFGLNILRMAHINDGTFHIQRHRRIARD